MSDSYLETTHDLTDQDQFDILIGRLDRNLSMMLCYAEEIPNEFMDTPNIQTLKHHAEDMIGAGQKILRLIEESED